LYKSLTKQHGDQESLQILSEGLIRVIDFFILIV